MNYGVKYTIPFRTTADRGYTIKILEKDYSGDIVELTGAPPTFVINQASDDDLLTRHRNTTATITILTDRVLTDLFAADPQFHKVIVYSGTFDFNGDFNADFCGNAPAVFWCGYIKPEVYTQDWHGYKAELTIQCQSEMSLGAALEFKVNSSDGFRVFRSFGSLIREFIEVVGGDYNNYYIPSTFGAGESVDGLDVSESAFFDSSTGAPITWLDVMDYICEFCGWTLCEHLGALYFVDPIVTSNGEKYGQFTKAGVKVADVLPASVSARDIKPRDTTANSIDIIRNYNYASVRAEAKSVEGSFPSVDFREFPQLYVLPATTFYPHDGKHYATFKEFRNPGDNLTAGDVAKYGYTFRVFSAATAGQPKRTWENIAASLSQYCNVYAGALPVRVMKFTHDDTDATNFVVEDRRFDLQDCVQCRMKHPTQGQTMPDYTPFLTIKAPRAMYSAKTEYQTLNIAGARDRSICAGAIVIHADIMTHFTPTMEICEEAINDYGTHADGLDFILCQLKIGNWYYGGEIVESLNGYGYAADTSVMWRENPEDEFKYFLLPISAGKLYDFRPVRYNKTIFMPFDVSDGFVIPLARGTGYGSTQLYTAEGDAELTFCASNRAVKDPYHTNINLYGYTLANLSVEYVPTSYSVQQAEERVYTNEKPEGYISQAPEYVTHLCSQDDARGQSYSTICTGGEPIRSIANAVTIGLTRPEEILLERVLRLYAEPKVKLTEGLRISAVRPIDAVKDPALSDNTKFLIVGRRTNLEYEKEVLTLVNIS